MLYTQQQLRQSNIRTIINESQSKLKDCVIQLFPFKIQYFYDRICYEHAKIVLKNQSSSELDKIFAANTIIALEQKYTPVFY